jgi:signal peptide peptidase SppA
LDKIAANDSHGLLVKLDSPGGAVGGLSAARRALERVRAKKPVYVATSRTLASAALWWASASDRIFADRLALVGSIGCFLALIDSSAAFESMGLKVIVVRSGAVKGSQVPGDPITDEMLAAHQEIVDGIAAQFTTDLSESRKIDLGYVTESLSTGQVWLGKAAQDHRLVDHIGDDRDALRELIAHAELKKRPQQPTTQTVIDEDERLASQYAKAGWYAIASQWDSMIGHDPRETGRSRRLRIETMAKRYPAFHKLVTEAEAAIGPRYKGV